MRTRADTLRGISRVDENRTHAWFVRLHYVDRVPRVVGTFSDQQHGGVKQSLEAAIEFRDAHISEPWR